MAARTIGNATVSFGLVSIPVKLFTALKASESISFRMLHADCGTPLKYQYWCPRDEEAVKRDAIVKGYEYAKDQYVLFKPEELKAIEEAATGAIAIEEFLPLDDVDPVYFDKPYYLTPDKGGERAWNLLAKAMRDKRIGGLAKYTARGKQYLVLVRPIEGGLVMQQLRYANEVRGVDELPVQTTDDVKQAELDLALQIIEQNVAEEFHPDKYEDEVRLRLEQAIQQKIEGEEVSVVASEAPQAQVVDLMEALKASLDTGSDRKPAKAAGKRGKRAAKKEAAGSRGRK